MECKTYQEQISLWLDQQLTSEEIRKLEDHAASCLVCRAALDGLRRVDRVLALAPIISPSPGFSARFQARFAARRRRSRTWAGLLTLSLATIAVWLGIAVIVAVSGLAIWESVSATGMLAQGIGLLLELGKVTVSGLKLTWLIFGALAQGLRHPVFVAYALATSILIAAWTQVVRQRILATRVARVDSHS